mmetsp:Transcript_7008/g.14360  ORF Transcript_7008/g.14360 Transcript_7008/m.14360 type:complete len:243 (+) Transcript_7008:1720-2448(+)
MPPHLQSLRLRPHLSQEALRHRALRPPPQPLSRARCPHRPLPAPRVGARLWSQPSLPDARDEQNHPGRGDAPYLLRCRDGGATLLRIQAKAHPSPHGRHAPRRLPTGRVDLPPRLDRHVHVHHTQRRHRRVRRRVAYGRCRLPAPRRFLRRKKPLWPREAKRVHRREDDCGHCCAALAPVLSAAQGSTAPSARNRGREGATRGGDGGGAGVDALAGGARGTAEAGGSAHVGEPWGHQSRITA